MGEPALVACCVVVGSPLCPTWRWPFCSGNEECRCYCICLKSSPKRCCWAGIGHGTDPQGEECSAAGTTSAISSCLENWMLEVHRDVILCSVKFTKYIQVHNLRSPVHSWDISVINPRSHRASSASGIVLFQNQKLHNARCSVLKTEKEDIEISIGNVDQVDSSRKPEQVKYILYVGPTLLAKIYVKKCAYSSTPPHHQTAAVLYQCFQSL